MNVCIKAWDRDDGVIYATLAKVGRPTDLGSNTTWGTINPLTGQINAIYQWENRDLVFTVGGISTLVSGTPPILT